VVIVTLESLDGMSAHILCSTRMNHEWWRLLLLVVCINCLCCRISFAACGPASVRYTAHANESTCAEYANGTERMSPVVSSIPGILGECTPMSSRFERWTCERRRSTAEAFAVKRTFVDGACQQEVQTESDPDSLEKSCSRETASDVWSRYDCSLSDAGGVGSCPPPLASVQLWEDDFCQVKDSADLNVPESMRYYFLNTCLKGGWGGSNVIYTCTADGVFHARNHKDALCLQPDPKRDFDIPAGQCNKGEVWSCLSDEFNKNRAVSSGAMRSSSLLPAVIATLTALAYAG